MAYILRPAAAGEIDAVFALFEQRVSWMNQRDIHQWNDTDYLNEYPKTYYQQQRELGNLYVLTDNADGAVAGAVVLLQSDDRWLDRAGSPAYYVHNLVTDPAARGAGRELLAQAEKLAVGHGKRFMRLDCAEDNAFLNRYYEGMCYQPAGTCEDGAYQGVRREKVLPAVESAEKTDCGNAVLNAIFDRSSYRGAFRDIPVPRSDLELILKAGVAAPSGCNRQTTAFVAVDDPEKVQAVRAIFQRPSCQSAPAFVMVFAQEVMAADGHFYHVEDFAAAMENMLLAIKALGYESCWYQGNVRDCAEALAAVVNMPERYRLKGLLPVGVPAEEPVKLKVKKPFETRAWFNEYTE